MKAGILGGTFNPIHNGHLLMAEEVRDIFSLDTLFFVPTNIPPHKEIQIQIENRHRINMLEKAIGSNSSFSLLDIELKRGGISYTIDTINDVYKQFNIDGKIYFIIGGDLINDIYTWKNYETLIEEINLVVVTRETFQAANYTEQFPFIFPVEGIPFHITSTIIRKRVSEQKTIKYLVPESVEEYIYANNLYQ